MARRTPGLAVKDTCCQDPRFSSKFATQGRKPTEDVVLVQGAGEQAVDGVYRKGGTVKNGCPVYVQLGVASSLTLSREVGCSKGGKVKHGWVLSCCGQSLYGVQSQGNHVPTKGWKQFLGKSPAPASVELFAGVEPACLAAARWALNKGQAMLESADITNALQTLNRALQVLSLSGVSLSEPFDQCVADLFAARASATCPRLEKSIPDENRDHKLRLAIRDAVAALGLVASHTTATRVFEMAAAEYFCLSADAEVQELLAVVQGGSILDPCAPFALDVVDQWLDQARHFAASREADRAQADGVSSRAPESRRNNGMDGAETLICEPGSDELLPDTATESCSGATVRPHPERNASRDELRLPGEIDPELHRAFVVWIGFPRAADIDDEMDRSEWVNLVAEKLTLMNWKFMGRRKNVDLSACDDNAHAVLELLGAFIAVGKPMEKVVRKLTDVERHLVSVDSGVENVTRPAQERVVWDGASRSARRAEDAIADAEVRRHLETNEALRAALPWHADDELSGRKGVHWRKEFVDQAAKEALDAGVPDLRGIGYPSPTAVR